MSKIKNITEIDTYEESKPEKIFIESHRNDDHFIILRIGKEKVTVVGNHLENAIKNCMNVGF